MCIRDSLGPLKYGQTQGEVFLGRDYTRSQDISNELAAAIDDEVRKLITQAHEEATQIIMTHREALDRIAAELIEKETLDAPAVIEVFHDVPKWSTPIAEAFVSGDRGSRETATD